MAEFESQSGFQEMCSPYFRGAGRARVARPIVPFPKAGGAARQRTRPKRVTAKDDGGGSKARLARVVRGAPEVTVKVTGRPRTAGHLSAHLDYISRHGKLEIETSDAELLLGKKVVGELAEQWSADNVGLGGPGEARKGSQSVSMVLSMPPGTNAELVRSAARAFAAERFNGYDYAFALHIDTDHPHVHLAVRSVGLDNRRLELGKGDLHDLREIFAAKLRERGVEAEATSRVARGLEGRADPSELARARKNHEEGRSAEPIRVDQSRRQQAANDDHAQAYSPPRRRTPTDIAMGERQTAVRARYHAAAMELAGSAIEDDRKLARDVAAYVERLPKGVQTYHTGMVDRLSVLRTQQAEQDRLRASRVDRASTEPGRGPASTRQPDEPKPRSPKREERER